MLTLCGFAASNYYNLVKFALLEKGIAFQEQQVWIGQADPSASPLGKLPYLLTEEGPLCESTVILEYLEAAYPQRPLLPANPYAAAKVRELVRFLELHVELEARKLYPEAYFGRKVDDAVKEKTARQLATHVAAFARLARFSPYLAGDTFTVADCAGAVHLPIVANATKIIYGRDFLAELPVRDYLKRLGELPHLQQVNADRKTATEALLARIRSKS